MKKKSKKVWVDLLKGVEGLSITFNNYRICGPKPWGGGKVIKSWNVDREEIFKAIEDL